MHAPPPLRYSSFKQNLSCHPWYTTATAQPTLPLPKRGQCCPYSATYPDMQKATSVSAPVAPAGEAAWIAAAL